MAVFCPMVCAPQSKHAAAAAAAGVKQATAATDGAAAHAVSLAAVLSSAATAEGAAVASTVANLTSAQVTFSATTGDALTAAAATASAQDAALCASADALAASTAGYAQAVGAAAASDAAASAGALGAAAKLGASASATQELLCAELVTASTGVGAGLGALADASAAHQSGAAATADALAARGTSWVAEASGLGAARAADLESRCGSAGDEAVQTAAEITALVGAEGSLLTTVAGFRGSHSKAFGELAAAVERHTEAAGRRPLQATGATPTKQPRAPALDSAFPLAATAPHAALRAEAAAARVERLTREKAEAAAKKIADAAAEAEAEASAAAAAAAAEATAAEEVAVVKAAATMLEAPAGPIDGENVEGAASEKGKVGVRKTGKADGVATGRVVRNPLAEAN